MRALPLNANMSWLPAAGLALCLLLTACALPRPQPTPAGPGVIFSDDFSDTNSGWDRYAGADIVTDYEDGRYLLAIEGPGDIVWARPGLDLADVAVETDTHYASGPENNEYGLLCRYARAGDGRVSFYFFAISSDGYYALGKVIRDVRTVLSPADGSFQPSAAIDTDPAAINRLRATCHGNRMELTVNDQIAGEFTDSDLSRGDVGVFAGSFDTGGVRIYFDDFVVSQP
jgi:hypothetical protein